MIVQGSTPVATPRDTGHGMEPTQEAPPPHARTDSVYISPEARHQQDHTRATLSPASMISEEQVQIKMGLVRTLMEILFDQTKEEENAEKSTPEEAMLQMVMEGAETPASASREERMQTVLALSQAPYL